MRPNGWVSVHSLVVTVLVALVSSRSGLVRLGGGDPDILGPGDTSVGRVGEVAVGLDVRRISAGVVVREPDSSGQPGGQHRDCIVEVISVVSVVVDFSFRRPGCTTVVRMTNVGVEVASVRVLIDVADEYAASMSTVQGRGREGHGKDTARSLRRNGNEEGSGIQTIIGHQVRGTEGRSAV